MDSLSLDLNNCNMGCVINNCKVNHLFYADDSVLLAPSPTALQELLNICSEYSKRFELSYNVKKTSCMVIKPKCLKNLKVPDFYLDDITLNFTECTKYLVFFINNECCDNFDIKRQLKAVYVRGNILIRKFGNCSDVVKSKLFKSYCSNFYEIILWFNFNNVLFDKLNVAY